MTILTLATILLALANFIFAIIDIIRKQVNNFTISSIFVCALCSFSAGNSIGEDQAYKKAALGHNIYKTEILFKYDKDSVYTAYDTILVDINKK